MPRIVNLVTLAVALLAFLACPRPAAAQQTPVTLLNQLSLSDKVTNFRSQSYNAHNNLLDPDHLYYFNRLDTHVTGWVEIPVGFGYPAMKKPVDEWYSFPLGGTSYEVRNFTTHLTSKTIPSVWLIADGSLMIAGKVRSTYKLYKGAGYTTSKVTLLTNNQFCYPCQGTLLNTSRIVPLKGIKVASTRLSGLGLGAGKALYRAVAGTIFDDDLDVSMSIQTGVDASGAPIYQEGVRLATEPTGAW